MGNKPKSNKFSEFLEKHKKVVVIYNIIIWTTVVILGILLALQAPDNLTQEEMEQQVKERCDNRVILPSNGTYQVKFNHNSLLNNTHCEVIYNGN